MIFKNSLSASWPVSELSSPRLDWQRVGLSASCPVSCYNGGTLKRTFTRKAVTRTCYLISLLQ